MLFVLVSANEDIFSLRYKTAVHQCEVCKKEFKGKSSLEMHFRTHSGKGTKEQLTPQMPENV